MGFNLSEEIKSILTTAKCDMSKFVFYECPISPGQTGNVNVKFSFTGRYNPCSAEKDDIDIVMDELREIRVGDAHFKRIAVKNVQVISKPFLFTYEIVRPISAEKPINKTMEVKVAKDKSGTGNSKP
jgi:hypothetical protein